ncbi:response regulator [Gemmata sp.]|uniref:response regulator n=1 Tax=Gemmata sp. TaxID=1914242 RepID=UPI003F6FB1E6
MSARLGNPFSVLSVLVVEDSADTAQSTADLLSMCGCRARVADGGPAGLRAAGEEVPDVVLLDIGLPGMDGWEVARRMRHAARGKQPLIVAVTGRGTDGDRDRSADAGIDLHLVKPVAPAALVLLLAQVRGVLAAHAPAPAAASGLGESAGARPAGGAPVAPPWPAGEGARDAGGGPVAPARRALARRVGSTTGPAAAPAAGGERCRRRSGWRRPTRR